MWRSFTPNSDVFYYGFSLGYVHYNQKTSYEGASASFSKKGVGTTIDIGYDIRLNGKNFIGFKLTYSSGAIDLEMKDASGNDIMESLAALNLTTGFRF